MFRFNEPGSLVDQELELELIEAYSGNPARNFVPAYRFSMLHAMTGSRMGEVELRIGNTERIVMYAGHIGYEVFPHYRGHHYAARSVRLLLPLARSHELSSLWITCNPDNFASRRTCELVGGKLVEIVNLPHTLDMYHQGERQKCRYLLEI